MVAIVPANKIYANKGPKQESPYSFAVPVLHHCFYCWVVYDTNKGLIVYHNKPRSVLDRS